MVCFIVLLFDCLVLDLCCYVRFGTKGLAVCCYCVVGLWCGCFADDLVCWIVRFVILVCFAVLCCLRRLMVIVFGAWACWVVDSVYFNSVGIAFLCF